MMTPSFWRSRLFMECEREEKESVFMFFTEVWVVRVLCILIKANSHDANPRSVLAGPCCGQAYDASSHQFSVESAMKWASYDCLKME